MAKSLFFISFMLASDSGDCAEYDNVYEYSTEQILETNGVTNWVSDVQSDWAVFQYTRVSIAEC